MEVVQFFVFFLFLFGFTETEPAKDIATPGALNPIVDVVLLAENHLSALWTGNRSIEQWQIMVLFELVFLTNDGMFAQETASWSTHIRADLVGGLAVGAPNVGGIVCDVSLVSLPIELLHQVGPDLSSDCVYL